MKAHKKGRTPLPQEQKAVQIPTYPLGDEIEIITLAIKLSYPTSYSRFVINAALERARNIIASNNCNNSSQI